MEDKTANWKSSHGISAESCICLTVLAQSERGLFANFEQYPLVICVVISENKSFQLDSDKNLTQCCDAVTTRRDHGARSISFNMFTGLYNSLVSADGNGPLEDNMVLRLWIKTERRCLRRFFVGNSPGNFKALAKIQSQSVEIIFASANSTRSMAFVVMSLDVNPQARQRHPVRSGRWEALDISSLKL